MPEDRKKAPSAKSKKTKKQLEQETRVKQFFIALVLVFVISIFGGWIGSRAFNDDNSGASTIGERIILEESNVIAEVADAVSPSVVSIDVTQTRTTNSFFFGTESFETQSAGTGIILTKDGLVVTNKHVIPQNATQVTIVLNDGTKYEKVEVIDRDPFNDIAYLQIRGAKNLTPAVLGDSSTMRVGDKVIAIGNALGQFANTVTSGIISGVGRPIVAGSGLEAEALQNLFQTDASINPGNSGGPLVNASGEVIAINTAVAGGAENIGFAIPINDVKPGIASIQDHGELRQPYLGVRYIAITDDIAQELELEVNRGALITAGVGQRAVLPNSPAAKAGLRDNDIITKVGDQQIDESNSLVTLVSQNQVGDVITLTVIRDSQELLVDVTLEEAPASL